MFTVVENEMYNAATTKKKQDFGRILNTQLKMSHHWCLDTAEMNIIRNIVYKKTI